METRQEKHTDQGTTSSVIWEVENKTLELETFGVQFPLALFERTTDGGADENLKRFADRLHDGEAAILSERWGAIDPGLQQAIRQVLELLALSAAACARSEGLQDPFLKTRADKEKIIAVRDLSGALGGANIA